MAKVSIFTGSSDFTVASYCVAGRTHNVCLDIDVGDDTVSIFLPNATVLRALARAILEDVTDAVLDTDP